MGSGKFGIPLAGSPRYDDRVKSLRVRAAFVVVAMLAITPVLAGCAFNPVESIIKQATGGDVDLGGANLPRGFPAEVPLVDGEIVFGGGIKADGGQVWNVTMKVKDPAVFDTITSQLTGAGFTANDGIGGTTDTGSVGTFQGKDYTVSVLVSTSGADTTVNYTVAAVTP